MSNLTGLTNGVFNTVHLVDETGDQQEVRDIFLTGSIEQSIPNVPTSSQVLSIPGLVTELQNNPGPKGEKGSKGSKMANLTFFLVIWDPFLNLGPSRPFQSKIDFLLRSTSPKATLCGFGTKNQFCLNCNIIE